MPRRKFIKKGDIIKHEDGSVYIAMENQVRGNDNLKVSTVVECVADYIADPVNSLFLPFGKVTIIGHMPEGWDATT